MFGFHKNKNHCPVPEDTRLWLEHNFVWLMTQFGQEKLENMKTMLPDQEHFPVQFDGTEQMAYNVMDIVARQMDVDPADIKLHFYDEQLMHFGSEAGLTLISEQYEDENYSAGQYWGRDADNKYSIAIELGQLKRPDDLIATLAHEIAHIKILGEGRLEENDEYLTDLVTVFFGLGIFNANASFRFQTDFEKWSYNKQGYLPQQEWGYALALYAYIQKEEKPDWIKFLTPNIQSDFKKSEAYIFDNTDKILQEPLA
jgi:hypothetical protein